MLVAWLKCLVTEEHITVEETAETTQQTEGQMVDIILDLAEALKPTPPTPCKGLVFRGKRNAFINGRGDYVYTERMALLKRKSCKGCQQCGYMLEELEEHLGNDCLPIMPAYLETDVMYKLEVTNISKDWETGIVDDWDLEFVKYVDEKDKLDKKG